MYTLDHKYSDVNMDVICQDEVYLIRFLPCHTLRMFTFRSPFFFE